MAPPPARGAHRASVGDEAAGLSPATVEYPIKSLDDHLLYEEIVRHTEYLPAYEASRVRWVPPGRLRDPVLPVGSKSQL